MTNKVFLKDFSKWKELNESFCLYDYIFQEMRLNNISTDTYFAFSELFWPTFTTHHGYVFLKENFSESKFEELKNSNKNIEFWINFLILDSYFENDEDGDVKATSLASTLVEIWQTKLRKDFPHLEFIVKTFSDAEVGDYGVAFYQRKYPLDS